MMPCMTVVALFIRTANAQGAVPMGEEAFEIARVLDGRPAPGAELTDDHNPLEAGLYHAASITKGCYIGQARLAQHGPAQECA